MRLSKHAFGTALAAFAIAVGAGEASADSSCGALFAKVREQASRQLNGAYQYVYFLWTTNYYVPDVNARFTAVARGQFQGSPIAPSMVLLRAVPIPRTETYYDPSLKTLTQKITPMQVILEADNKLTLGLTPGDARFGPFDPHCFADKFAVIDSGDSLEVFTFVGSGPPSNFSEPIQ